MSLMMMMIIIIMYKLSKGQCYYQNSVEWLRWWICWWWWWLCLNEVRDGVALGHKKLLDN